MSENILSKRLLWFANRVRHNVTFADIGTDHAKLPVYLVKSSTVSRAIASDIGEGPISHARAYININGLSNRIETYVGNGLEHLKFEAPADIAICGMGGETIISIIDNSSFIKNYGYRLLLQPMTDFSAVRNYLADNGFSVIDEDIVESDNKLYQCIIAEYTGEKYSLTEIESELGKLCIKKSDETFLKYINKRYSIMKKRYEEKTKSNADTSEEVRFISEYKKLLKREDL